MMLPLVTLAARRYPGFEKTAVCLGWPPIPRVVLGRAIMAAPHPIGVAAAGGRAGQPDWWAIIDRCLGRVGRLCEQQCRVHDMRKLEEELAERACSYFANTMRRVSEKSPASNR